MTDAAVPITQTVVERFTEQYLRSLDATIDNEGNRWSVSLPKGTDTELPTSGFGLVCGKSSSELDAEEVPLHPESSFFQTILSEASDGNPAGRIRIVSEDTAINYPPWLNESGIETSETNFTPYYDRTAVVILYRIRIETVSEYQTELLRAVALDIRSMDFLPELEPTFLEATSPDSETVDGDAVTLEESRTREAIERTRSEVVDRVQPIVDEIHEEASRAADAELEEFRQMQQQHIEELEERKSSIISRIDELNDSIQASNDEVDHVEDLKQRKDLKQEVDEVESELATVRRRREQGFPVTQRDIRNRHALEVVVSPLTITQVEYERGEIEFTLEHATTTRKLTLGYGCGIGVTEEVHCDSCDRVMTEENPLGAIRKGIQCRTCGTGDESGGARH